MQHCRRYVNAVLIVAMPCAIGHGCLRESPKEQKEIGLYSYETPKDDTLHAIEVALRQATDGRDKLLAVKRLRRYIGMFCPSDERALDIAAVKDIMHDFESWDRGSVEVQFLGDVSHEIVFFVNIDSLRRCAFNFTFNRESKCTGCSVWDEKDTFADEDEACHALCLQNWDTPEGQRLVLCYSWLDGVSFENENAMEIERDLLCRVNAKLRKKGAPPISSLFRHNRQSSEKHSFAILPGSPISQINEAAKATSLELVEGLEVYRHRTD